MREPNPKMAPGHRHDPVPHKGGRGQKEAEVVPFQEARFGVKDKAKPGT